MHWLDGERQCAMKVLACKPPKLHVDTFCMEDAPRNMLTLFVHGTVKLRINMFAY
jgi:hypothetical protein